MASGMPGRSQLLGETITTPSGHTARWVTRPRPGSPPRVRLPPRPRPRLQPHTLVPLVTPVPKPSYRLVHEIQPGQIVPWGTVRLSLFLAAFRIEAWCLRFAALCWAIGCLSFWGIRPISRPLLKEPMKKTKLQDYRRQVEIYFEMEYSDLPLEQVLFRLPEKYSEKVGKVVRLHHSIKKPPANAAAYAMRIVRGPCRSLIVGQTEGR